MIESEASSQGTQESPRLDHLTIHVLDDDRTMVRMIVHQLEQKGCSVIPSHNLTEARAVFQNYVPDVSIVDVYLGEESGLEYVRELRSRYPELGIVVISADDTETLAQQAQECGADQFLHKPIFPAALAFAISRVAEQHRQREITRSLKEAVDRSLRDRFETEILTHSDAMEGVLHLIEKVSRRDLSVLVYGESGTGKELVARAIHGNSGRRNGSFVELNCAALPANLVESELFGHEKGAFTGAVASRVGRMEQAHGGTLFLDEIGELPPEIQPKLLRSLQEKRITRVGGKRDIQCDFRLVSATNRDLLGEVRSGRFREDLFYRVAVFPIKLPPLRERVEDIELLLIHFLRQEGMQSPRISAEARERLRAYSWPGNVRQLKNFAQAIPLLVSEDVIDAMAVENYFGTRLGEVGAMLSSSPDGSAAHDMSMRPVRKLADVEREEIFHALRYYKGEVPHAAMALGMGRATLYKYISRYGLDLDDFR